MSFGFGVGDFLAVLELARDVRRRFMDAPEQFTAISKDVKSLSSVLQDVEDTLSQRDLTESQQRGLKNHVQDCQEILKELKDKLDTFSEVQETTGKGSTNKIKRVWKRLNWDQDVVEEFRRRITLNIGCFNAFLEQMNLNVSFSIKEDVSHLREKQEEQARQRELKEVLKWLAPIDYTPQHADFFSRLYEGTGQWLFDSDEFKAWIKSKNVLFCPGIPGAGKTTLSAAVVEYLLKRGDRVAFVYCNFRRQHEQKAVDVLSNILAQLAPAAATATKKLKKLHEMHGEGKTKLSFGEIIKELQSLDYPRVFIVIDALDECQMSDIGDRKRLLKALFGLERVNLFVTSRFIPEIVTEFDSALKVEIRAHEEDIRRYLEGNMSALPGFVGRNAALQHLIQDEIIKAVNGMFLLAKLHLDSLRGAKSPRAVKLALANLPKGSEAYDEVYRDAMARIELSVSADLAKQVLAWIAYSQRPFRTFELQHALAIEPDEEHFDEENIPELEDIVSACAGLVTVDEESQLVRLVHYTTQEFFDRTKEQWFPNGSEEIAAAILRYVSYDVYDTLDGVANIKSFLKEYPFYDYARTFFSHHVPFEMASGFFKNEAKTSYFASRCISPDGYYRRPTVLAPRNYRSLKTTGLHLAAWFGMEQAVRSLLTEYEVDVRDSEGRTALFWAASRKHGTWDILLEAGADISAQDNYGRTPFYYTVGMGDVELLKRLLKTAEQKVGIDINRADKEGQTLLHTAVDYDQLDMLEFLLQMDGIDANIKDADGKAPFTLAAEKPHGADIIRYSWQMALIWRFAALTAKRH